MPIEITRAWIFLLSHFFFPFQIRFYLDSVVYDHKAIPNYFLKNLGVTLNYLQLGFLPCRLSATLPLFYNEFSISFFVSAPFFFLFMLFDRMSVVFSLKFHFSFLHVWKFYILYLFFLWLFQIFLIWFLKPEINQYPYHYFEICSLSDIYILLLTSILISGYFLLTY